jgi:hypothetical protein
MSLLTLVLVVLASAVAPSGLYGQTTEIPQIAPDRLAVFVETHKAIGHARDAVHLELAETKNKTPEAQELLREKLRDQIAAILRDNAMTGEEYTRITFAISADPDQRRAFELLVNPDAPPPAAAPAAQAPLDLPAAVATHIAHVRDAFRDTPDGRGLLPIAIAEAEVAAQHAALAARTPDNLDAMKLHAGHVLHAVDPSAQSRGPGLGYGVKKAAEGVATHVDLAAKAEGATRQMSTHATHIVTSARNTAERADRIIALVAQIQAATSAADAADLVSQLESLAAQLISGEDADADGRVGWEEGEGGLQHVEQHLNLLIAG